MSKRKPALRIGGGILNRSSLSVKVTDGQEVQPTIKDKDPDDMDMELANFLKQIDEVSTVPAPSNAEQPERFGDWQKCIDEKTQHPYYWNVVTDEVTWVLPEEFHSIDQTQLDKLHGQVDEGHDSSPPENKETESYPKPLNESPTTQLPEQQIQEKEEQLSQNTEADVEEEKFEGEIQEKEILQDTAHGEEEELEKITEELKTKEASVQCNLHSNDLGIGNDDASMKTQVLKLKDTLFGKMNFLGVSKSSLIGLQILLIQVETRLADWKAKVLPTSYVIKRFEEAAEQLKTFEEGATPPGWTCHWDSSAGQYFYVNKKTQQKQWSYPDLLKQEDGDEEQSEDGVAAKRVKVDDSYVEGSSAPPLPPLPNTPQEKPPPPPQPEEDGCEVGESGDSEEDQDDGIMMEISDGEKEDADTEPVKKTMPLPVLSQQPVLYKGSDKPLVEDSHRSLKTMVPVSQNPPLYPSTQLNVNSSKIKFKKIKSSKKSANTKKPHKAMSSLVAQWQRAKDEIEQEERMLEEDDEEEEVETSRVKIQKWKQDQIASGRALSNPNFEPVPADWRSRLLGKKRNKP